MIYLNIDCALKSVRYMINLVNIAALHLTSSQGPLIDRIFCPRFMFNTKASLNYRKPIPFPLKLAARIIDSPLFRESAEEKTGSRRGQLTSV